MENTNTEEKKISYPTSPNEEGFFFETEDEKNIGILTKLYENKRKVKEFKLSTGQLAVVRSLKAKDTVEVSRYMNQNQDLYLMSMITVSTTFNGSKMPIEEVENLDMKDYQILMAMCTELNF